jgi:hypothetical protein
MVWVDRVVERMWVSRCSGGKVCVQNGWAEVNLISD